MFNLLASQVVDYTVFFRTLSTIPKEELESSIPRFEGLFSCTSTLSQWLKHYVARLELESIDDQDRLKQMQQSNPKYILRNYLAQQAIELAEQGDFSMVDQLLLVLADPYSEHPKYEGYAALPPQWGKELEVSCSS